MSPTTHVKLQWSSQLVSGEPNHNYTPLINLISGMGPIDMVVVQSPRLGRRMIFPLYRWFHDSNIETSSTRRRRLGPSQCQPPWWRKGHGNHGRTINRCYAVFCDEPRGTKKFGTYQWETQISELVYGWEWLSIQKPSRPTDRQTNDKQTNKWIIDDKQLDS